MALLCYEKLAKDLELAILSGKLTAGERMPSLRELAASRGVSVSTVRQAMEMLCGEGLVEVRPQRGFFVCRERAENAGPVISVIHHRAANSEEDPLGVASCTLALRGILQENLKIGANLKIHYEISLKLPQLALEGILEEDGADAAILLGGFDWIPRSWRTTVPLTGVLLETMYSGQLSSIVPDPMACAELAMNFFRERGVREIRACCLPQSPTPDAFTLIRSFWDGTVRDIPLSPAVPLPENLPGVGYLFRDGSRGDHAAKMFRKIHRVPMAQAMPVLTMDGKNFFNPDYDPMNTIVCDWELAGRLALKETVRRLREPGPGIRICLPVRMECCKKKCIEE